VIDELLDEERGESTRTPTLFRPLSTISLESFEFDSFVKRYLLDTLGHVFHDSKIRSEALDDSSKNSFQ
jgi:hypothetical protein